MSAPKIKLESVVNDQSPDAAQARKIVAIFDSDFNVVDPTELSAERTASAIDDLFKAEYARDQGEEAVEGFFWNLWTTLLEVVKLVPATDARMHHLADVLAALHGKKTADVEIWDEKMAVWEDLPILGPQMREAWNICPKYDGTDNDALLQGWISLNSFAARTLYFRPNAYNLGIWQLRSALEEPLPEKPTAQHTQLAAACEWITHAGKQLHSLCTQGSADERTIQITKAGSQFSGSGGPSQERWQFWKSRLTSLKGVVTSEGLKERIEGVVEIMNDMEK